MWEANMHMSAWQLARLGRHYGPGLNWGGRKALLDAVEENSQTGGNVAVSREI